MILQGDCRDVLPTLEAESIDACVTDPPYELGFMGKAWDSTGVANDPETWRQVLRVLKPGGHLLSFGGTRTYHRMVCAIEDAGFEIRDCIQWLYGSGFPKSHNVAVAIDKEAGAVGHRVKAFNLKGRGERADLVDFVESQRDRPTGYEPATEAARQWDGWGTALKPAAEIICLARKPLVGTVAENVQAHGTGALNIDGCRIEAEKPTGWGGKAAGGNTWNDANSGLCRDGEARPVEGRWPSNVILDPEAARVLDEQSGESETRRIEKPSPAPNGNTWGGTSQTNRGARGHTDFGGASRFFYVAKPSRAERGEGNNHPTVKPLALLRYLVRLVTPPGGIVLDPFAGSGTTLWAAQEEGFRHVGIELNPEYIAIAERRMSQQTLWMEAAG